MLRVIFLCLAGVVFFFGSGVAEFPISYMIVVALVFITSDILERKHSPYLAPVLLVSSSTLVAILLAEIGLRVGWDDRLFYRSHDRFFERSTEFRDSHRYVPSVQSTRRIHGDLAAFSGAPSDRVYRMERFITDGRGFRNANRDSSEKVNVIVLGDSFAAGSDTTQEETWTQVMRDELKMRVYNLGLPGSPADELRVLVTELPHLSVAENPIVVWMIFSGNDFEPPYESSELLSDPSALKMGLLESLIVTLYNSQSRSALSRLFGSIKRVEGTPLVERRTIPGVGQMLFYRPYIEMATRNRHEIEGSLAYASLRRTMRKMRQFSQASRFSVLVVAAPSKEDVYLRTYMEGEKTAVAQVLEGLSQEVSFDFLDLGPLFVKSAKERALWWSDDTHWNSDGNRVAAEAIAARLRSER